MWTVSPSRSVCLLDCSSTIPSFFSLSRRSCGDSAPSGASWLSGSACCVLILDHSSHDECDVGSLCHECNTSNGKHCEHDLLLGSLEALIDQGVVDAVDAVERRSDQEQHHRQEVTDVFHSGLRSQERYLVCVVDEVQKEEVEGEDDDEKRRRDTLEEPAGTAGRKRGVTLGH